MLIASAAMVAGCDTWKAPFRPKDPDWRRLAVPRTPLPSAAFRVRWDAHTIPPAMPRGSEADIRISFTNLGDAVWPDNLSGDPVARDGSYAVRVAYDWSPAAPAKFAWPAHRADLPHPLRPGAQMTLLLNIVAPREPGMYRLEVHLLQELVDWFATRGAPILAVPITIT